MPVGLVVTELNLGLEGGELAGLFLGARVSTLHDGFLGLKLGDVFVFFTGFGQKEKKEGKKMAKMRSKIPT